MTVSVMKPIDPVRYNPRSLTRSPGFWRGAAATREVLGADPARTTLVHRLLATAEAGRDPTETEDYRAWLGYARALLVAAVLIVPSAGQTAATDWELTASTVPTLPRICSTTESICHATIRAVRVGWLAWPRAYDTCRPSPWCRKAHEDCIRGYDC